jgi:hypothetical protein
MRYERENKQHNQCRVLHTQSDGVNNSFLQATDIGVLLHPHHVAMVNDYCTNCEKDDIQHLYSCLLTVVDIDKVCAVQLGHTVQTLYWRADDKETGKHNAGSPRRHHCKHLMQYMTTSSEC